MEIDVAQERLQVLRRAIEVASRRRPGLEESIPVIVRTDTAAL